MGVRVSFQNIKFHLQLKVIIIGSGTLQSQLYYLDILTNPSSMPSLTFRETSNVTSLQIWHEHLSLVDDYTITSIASNYIITGRDLPPKPAGLPPCRACTYGKTAYPSFPRQQSETSTHLLSLVHTYVLGPLQIPSLGGSRYFISFVDDISKWIVTYPMRNKSEFFGHFRNYHTFAERHTGRHIDALLFYNHQQSPTIKFFRTYNRGEYLSKNSVDYLNTCGIRHQLTIPYTPQQNGVSERLNRTLMEIVRSTLHQHSVDNPSGLRRWLRRSMSWIVSLLPVSHLTPLLIIFGMVVPTMFHTCGYSVRNFGTRYLTR